jgi:hypothetical protein
MIRMLIAGFQRFPESLSDLLRSTDCFKLLWHAKSMPKKNGSLSIKTIEQVRQATQADLKRVKNNPPTVASERKQKKNR